MTKQKEIYKCNICGNIVEVLHHGAGELVCCGQPMQLIVAKIKEEGSEKHLPVIEKDRVVIGEVEHPSEDNHYIEWIEINTKENSSKKFLNPGDKPEVNISGDVISVRAYCNIHGLWKV